MMGKRFDIYIYIHYHVKVTGKVGGQEREGKDVDIPVTLRPVRNMSEARNGPRVGV